METVEVSINHISEARNLRVVGVQLTSPFMCAEGALEPDLKFSPEAKLPIWNAQQLAIKHRIDRVHGILDLLSGVAGDKLPLDVIAFPEYSVPSDAHNDGRFQAFADQHKCILIPGTFVGHDDGRPAEYQRNLCRIYIPYAPSILIGKRHPTPDEAKYVSPYDGPNLARLVWTPPGREAVSLTIFLCRDYLTPYGPGATSDRRLLTDWDREGLHIAIMHSDETRLFEGVAGLDLRDLRGKAKLAFFVNNAGCAKELGSALLGPNSTRERDDVVRSLPIDEEGILTADVRLWNIRSVTQRPNRSLDEPVLSIRRDSLVRAPDGSVAVAPLQGQAQASFRGIWRPAFLAASGMAISVELYAARKLNRAISLVKEHAENAYSGVVRGEHDVLIRRYIREDDLKGGVGPDFARELSPRAKADLSDAFQNAETRTMTAVVFPKDIWKYRGRCTIDDKFEEMTELLAERLDFGVNEAEHKRRLIEDILSYANQCAEHSRPKHNIRGFFYDEDPERVIPVRPYTELRETYLFLDVGTMDNNRPDPTFEREVLKTDLMQDNRVREIFKLSHTKPEHFNYLVKLKCKAHEADDIGRKVREWAELHSLNAASRTVDIMEYLAQDSVSGIEVANRERVLRNFIAQLRGIQLNEDDVEIASLIRKKPIDTVEAAARAWEEARSAANTSLTRGLKPEVMAFFANMLFFSAKHSDKYFQGCQTAWMRIFRELEYHCAEALEALYTREFGHTTLDEFEINDALKDKYFPQWSSSKNASQWQHDRGNTIKFYFRVIGAEFPGEFDERLKRLSTLIEKNIRALRNDFEHGSRRSRMEVALDLTKGAHKEKITSWAGTISTMFEAIDTTVEALKRFAPPVENSGAGDERRGG